MSSLCIFFFVSFYGKRGAFDLSRGSLGPELKMILLLKMEMCPLESKGSLFKRERKKNAFWGFDEMPQGYCIFFKRRKKYLKDQTFFL